MSNQPKRCSCQCIQHIIMHSFSYFQFCCDRTDDRKQPSWWHFRYTDIVGRVKSTQTHKFADKCISSWNRRLLEILLHSCMWVCGRTENKWPRACSSQMHNELKCDWIYFTKCEHRTIVFPFSLRQRHSNIHRIDGSSEANAAAITWIESLFLLHCIQCIEQSTFNYSFV